MSSNEDDHSEKTYQVLKGGANEKGIKYERIFISTIILELVLDDDVQDFQLSSNDANYLPFDDVVIEIKRSGQIEEKLAIQLKHEGRTLSTQNLIQKKGEFSIKNNFERTKDCKILETFEKIIFTNRKFGNINDSFTLEGESFTIKKTLCNSKLFSDHFRGKGVPYKFELSDEKTDENYDQFLKHFYLYGSQLDVDQLEEKLRQKFQQVFNCEKSTFMEYLSFITKWSKKEGTRKKLYKSWIKDVIAVLLLSPYIQPVSSDIQDNNEKSDILLKSINNFDITVFEEKDSERIAKLWSINKAFENVDKQSVNRLNTKYQINSSYIEKFDDLSKEESSMLLWLLDKCPLIIKYNKCVIKAVQFMKEKKIVILYNDHEGRDFTKSFYNFKIFQNLIDLKENLSLYEEIVKTFHCSLQGKQKISLEILIGENENFEEEITTNDLLLLLSDNFMIGNEIEKLPDIYIERHFSRHIIDNNFLSEVDKNSVIIISNFKTTNKYFRQFHIVDIETLLKQDLENLTKDKSKSRKTIYFCKNNCSYKTFETICSTLSGKSKYHHLRMCNEQLEWICSRGGIGDLKQFQSEGDLVEEKVVYECNNNILIICGDPGLGKTTSTRYIQNCTYPSFWTVLIFPKDHSKYFREKQQNEKSFEQYIKEEVSQKVSEFGFKVFQYFLKNGRVNFVWDGLDEISDTYLDKVLDVIETFSKKGIKQFITSRNNLRNVLEHRFSAFATTIKQFDEKEQKYYIKNRLRCSEEELEILFRKIQDNISLFKYNEILGIPLQIFMFTELFIQDREKYSALLTNTFSLTDLYYHFINEKFNFFFKEKVKLLGIGSGVEQTREWVRKYKISSYQHLAVQLYFSEECVSFIDYDRCRELLNEIRKDKDSVGFITAISSDNLPNFIHNTYGEYFAALWLSENYSQNLNLSQFLFKEKYNNIRFFFDLILAKDCPAHIAVLCKNFQVLKNCDENSLTSEDRGGRHPLQLACSYGERYPLLNVTEEGLFHGNIRKRYFVDTGDENQIEKSYPDKNILRFLLHTSCNPENTDQVYKLNSYSYADETFSFSNLAILSEKYIVHFRNLKNFKSIPVILYYSAAFDFFTIFNRFRTIPRVYTQEGDSLLSVAASKGSLSSCQQLIRKYNANINSTNKYKETPLHEASSNGHVEIVKLLIDSKANVDAVNEDGWTPLHIASENGHIETVKLLIDNKANFNAGIENGYTPLHVASQNGQVEIVKLLIDNKANVDAGIENGDTPLRLASGNGHFEIVKLLIDNKANVDAGIENGDTPLYIASRNGHVEIVKLLIDKEANIDAATKSGYTPLHEASQNGQVEIVKLLIDNKAKVDAGIENGYTPLRLASGNGHFEIVKLLIDNKAKVNAGIEDDYTPLHWASTYGHVEIVKLLIDNKAKVNAGIENGYTPLYWASQNGHVEIVDLLIKNGAKL